MTPFSAYVLNMTPAHPVQLLAAGFFFAFALFPGGNFLLALAITVPIVLSFAYAFGLLTRLMPRTGGDYILAGRVLHPAWGLVSSIAYFIASLISMAYFALAVVNLGIGPGLSAVGLVGGSSTLVEWGNTVVTDNTWKYVLGIVAILIAAGIQMLNWRLRSRTIIWLFWIATGGVTLSALIALFTSHSDFINNFNSFAEPHTHIKNTYDSVIATAQKEGVATNAPFSFSNTVGMVGVLAIATIYPFTTSWNSGELQEAKSSKTAHIMALGGVTPLIVVAIFAAIFLNTFGTAFMTAANGGGFPLETPATYFFLISASTGSTILTVILTLAYLLYWPLIMYIAFIQPTRAMFAYSFDGLLPKSVTKLSSTNAPVVAIAITVVLSGLVLLWGIHSSLFLTLVVYGVLFAMVSQISVGIAAIVVPWRRKALYQAGGMRARFLGVPVVTWAGIGAVISGVFVVWMYLHFEQFGVGSVGKAAAYVGGGIVIALLFYAIARFVRRRRDGYDISLALSEIPPE
ncbi:MAG: amino acid permease [Actinobacteria bacterium]|nr:amino acid permease [Actinomycetota bacterium]